MKDVVSAVFIHSWLGEFKGGGRCYEFGSIDDLNIRVFGDIAVVAGRSVLAGSYQGKKASATQRFTGVFIKRDGRWQAVASQGTQITQSPNR